MAGCAVGLAVELQLNRSRIVVEPSHKRTQERDESTRRDRHLALNIGYTSQEGRTSWGNGGLDLLKICRSDQSMFSPLPKMTHFSFKTVVAKLCNFYIIEDERPVSKWKVKLIFRGAWNSLWWLELTDIDPLPHILRQIYATASQQ